LNPGLMTGWFYCNGKGFFRTVDAKGVDRNGKSGYAEKAFYKIRLSGYFF